MRHRTGPSFDLSSQGAAIPMVSNVAEWWTVHAGYWWLWCTQGGRVVMVVCAGRWAPGGGRARESAAFSDARGGMRNQATEAERYAAYWLRESEMRTGVSGHLNGSSREQLDAAEEEDPFALFADRFNDAAINPQHEAWTRRPPTLRHQLAPLRHQMSMTESDDRHDFLQDADMGELYAWANST